jgi:hypothetical protein
VSACLRRLAISAAFACSVSAALASAPAFANDSTAELTTGGLVLAKSPSVEMRSEDLFVSEKEIRVRYRFFNAASEDVTATVAFPMPDVVFDGPDTGIAVPTQNAENFLDFQSIADGKPVTAGLEQKILVKGADRTAQFKTLGVPLTAQFHEAAEALDGLSPEHQAELRALEAAIPDDYDVGKGMEHHMAPSWTLKSTYFWTQTFPAGREIVIEHHYRPSIGETSGNMLGSTYLEREEFERYRATYCIDADFFKAAKGGKVKPDNSGVAQSPFFERRIAYVLTTGANWAKPIGDFHLVVDKGSPDSLVSFCADGVKKISATQFEIRHANFSPSQDLRVLILYRPKP